MNKKLLFIVNVDWFFISHRLPIALEAIKKGYQVHIICGITDKQELLESFGLIVHAISMKRSGVNIWNEIKLIYQMDRYIKNIKPDVIHCITIKPVAYGGFLSRLRRVKIKVFSISGLGYVFIDSSLKSLCLRFITSCLYKLSLKGSNSKVIFQNEIDKSLFIKQKIIDREQAILIRGSGVDLDKFKFMSELDGSPIVMFLARLLKDKGVQEFCEASYQLIKSGVDARFVLVGDVDLDNPNSLTKKELFNIVENSPIEHWGYSNNVEDIYPKAHIVVLPSYREGLPKSLLEAAACGRAVITTDVPGCRDAITPGETGILVSVKSSDELRDAIQDLLLNKSKRQMMGIKGRELAIECFDIKDVVSKHIQLYRGDI